MRRAPAETLIVTSANMEGIKQPRRNFRRYNRTLKRVTRRVAKRHSDGRRILARQEVARKGRWGNGTKSTRVRTWKLRRTKQRWKVVGRGVHNGVAWRDVLINSRRIRVMSAHGLHLRTVGRRRQSDYYTELRQWIESFPPRIDGWILAGDFNRKHKVIARFLGARSVGHRIDGVIVSRNLGVKRVRLVEKGVRRGWTDHHAVIAKVRIK